MTYRELIEVCNKTPNEKCWLCKYKKECIVFESKTNGKMPVALYEALNIDFDAEIEVEE